MYSRSGLCGQTEQEISGLDGDDIIQGNNGDDIIYGNNGSDSIQGGGGLDNIFGGDGNDFIYADSSTSLSSALAGNQSAILNILNDRFSGTVIENFALPNSISINQNNVADIFASLNSNMLIFSQSHLGVEKEMIIFSVDQVMTYFQADRAMTSLNAMKVLIEF